MAVSTSEFGAEGGEGQVAVTTTRDCVWQLESDAAWLTVASTDPVQGTGAARFAVASTADPVARSAALTIADQQVMISQRPAPCRYELSRREFSIPASGGGGEVDVTASSALCEWTVRADSPWVSIPTGDNYKGNARIAFQVPEWTGPLRRVDLAVADQRVVVTQSSGCIYQLTSSSADMPSSASEGSVSVQTSDGCAWSAESHAAWVRILGSAAAAGPGPARFAVDPNPARPRSARLTIAGRPFVISQASGCQYHVNIHNATFPAEGGSATVMITASNPDCPWASGSHADWITFTTNSSGAGTGHVSFQVAANPLGFRSGTLSIAGHAFTAYQLGALGGN